MLLKYLIMTIHLKLLIKERNLSLLLGDLNLIDRITSKENEDKLRYLNDILNR